MADPGVFGNNLGIQAALSSNARSALLQALVAFGSCGFHQVLKATARQHVRCIDYRGADLMLRGEEEHKVAGHLRRPFTEPTTHASRVRQHAYSFESKVFPENRNT